MPEQGLLVDTDVLSYVATAQPQGQIFAPLLMDRFLFVSFATIGEIYFGAEKANWGSRRIRDIEEAIKRYTVIPGTFEVAKQYGRVKKSFRGQVDDNDMWIAATALARELPVVSNNLKHFEPMSNELGFVLVHPDKT